MEAAHRRKRIRQTFCFVPEPMHPPEESGYTFANDSFSKLHCGANELLLQMIPFREIQGEVTQILGGEVSACVGASGQMAFSSAQEWSR